MSDTNPVAALARFFGAFHPLLVHLPIGFLVLLATLEALALHPKLRHLAAASKAILALTIPAALLSACTGWLLAGGGGYDPELLRWHRWTGASAAAAVLCVAVVQRLCRPSVYRLSLWGTLVLTAVAAHWGGSLTHGRGYLARAAPAWLRSSVRAPPRQVAPADPFRAPVYQAAIQPMFTKYCVSCHGPDKAKAGLRLDSHAALLHGGDDGPVIEPCAASRSLLIQRLLLAPEEDDHMPPDGKPQPTADDIALLRWWVDTGAPADQSADELHPSPEVRRILSAR
jgi:uncharacterized membrane protein